MPFGWVCFSNDKLFKDIKQMSRERLNCLSAGSVSLTFVAQDTFDTFCGASQLPFGWVCFSNPFSRKSLYVPDSVSSQLPFGWVCFSNLARGEAVRLARFLSQLPFGWVCFSNSPQRTKNPKPHPKVSIAFRLGLFL